jgi:serine protease AprX
MREPEQRSPWTSLVLVSLVLTTCSACLTAANKISPELERLDSTALADVIVQFRDGATPVVHERIVGLGGVLHRSLDLIRGAHYRIPAGMLTELAMDPDVEFIHPNRRVAASDFSGTVDYGWMSTVGFTSNWQTLAWDGTGISVAVIDSGISNHPDLSGRVVYNESFVPNQDPNDHYGHGIHVAGLIGGNGSKSTGGNYFYTVRGIAPNVNLINLKALDLNGQGTDSQVIAAIQIAVALKPKYNIRVINLSLGRQVAGPYANDPLCQAVQQAWQAGIVVVVAAGNEGRNNSAGTSGYGTIAAPGNSPYVITVGAMNTVGTLSRSDDKVASYSSKGPTAFDHVVKPDLVAPGNQMVSLLQGGSTLDNNYHSNQVPTSAYSSNGSNSGSDYYQLSGTSMAAPIVSGAAALLLQQNPTWTPDQVKASLMMTADKIFLAASMQIVPGFTTATDPATGTVYTSYYDIFTVGAGYVNIAAALGSGNVPPVGLSANSPSAVPTTTSGAIILINGSNVIWGSSEAWDSKIVWGSNAYLDFASRSRSNVVWGGSADATEATMLTLNGDK